MRELRHDFRRVYHVRYDDVEPDEAVDLVLTLPEGSLYRSSGSKYGEWSDLKNDLADIKDILYVCAMRLSGHAGELGRFSSRPRDIEAMEADAARARAVKERLSTTEWEAV